jgi:hypothetical protein
MTTLRVAYAVAAIVGLVLIAGLGAGTAILSSSAACQNQAAPNHATSADIPSTYLDLYQQAGRRTDIPWTILAAIGKVESDHGTSRAPGVHNGANAAGAAGPMQIGIGGRAGNTWGGTPRHRGTQKTGGYGIDGNNDGWADVYDPADAIPAAAGYLTAHGALDDIPKAIFAYNHSTSYVNLVLIWSQRYGHSPDSNCSPILSAPSQTTARILSYAYAQIGKPYRWGAAGPNKFDCSGLTMKAYAAAGISIPRTTFYQWSSGVGVIKGQEKPGDLVFFNTGPNSSPKHPGHVGLVIGNGKMIEARCTRCGPIAISTYRTRQSLIGFRRLWDARMVRSNTLKDTFATSRKDDRGAITAGKITRQ